MPQRQSLFAVPDNASVTPVSPLALQLAAVTLRWGGLVIFPTDTVYGVGCALSRLDAVERIYGIKGRDRSKPLQVFVASAAAAEALGRGLTPLAQQAMSRLLPGPVTLVVKNGELVPPAVVAGGATVGIRMPDHPVCRALVQALGEPLAVTSANRSGHPSPVTAAEAAAELGAEVDLVLDGGPCPAGRESTVIDLTCEPPRVVRWGAMGRAELERLLETPVL
jgi:L-threonylcarbamoyladenylate synthase